MTIYCSGDFLSVDGTHDEPLTYWVRATGYRYNPDWLRV